MSVQETIGELILSESRFMQVTIKNIIDAYGKKYGLKAQHMHVLGLISYGDGLTFKQLSDHARILPSNLSPLCTALEEKGYVRKERDATDGRSSHLYLTNEGTQVLQGFNEWLDRILSCAGSENERLHGDIERGFSAFRKLIELAEKEDTH